MARPGERNKQITLQKDVQTVGSFGDTATSYVDVATVWARIEWGSGRRFEAARQANAEVQGIIGIVYRSDIKPTWRVKYRRRYFYILSLANMRERDRELVLWCKEALD